MGRPTARRETIATDSDGQWGLNIRAKLSTRQTAVLRLVADGCPTGVSGVQQSGVRGPE